MKAVSFRLKTLYNKHDKKARTEKRKMLEM